MLEIVERILAALIILALLTLLIILAFPVPPRQTTGPTNAAQKPPSEPVREADNRTATKNERPIKEAAPEKPPQQPVKEAPPSQPKSEVKGASSSETEADIRAEEARRRAEIEERNRRKAKPLHRAEARDCPDADCSRPVRSAGVSPCPDTAGDCGCGDDRRRRTARRNTYPYWAEPRRRHAAREDDPDWYDERSFDPGPPPGTCPD